MISVGSPWRNGATFFDRSELYHPLSKASALGSLQRRSRHARESSTLPRLKRGGLSRKFWSAKNFGPRSKFFGKIGPGGHCFSEKNGPDSKILVRCSLIKNFKLVHVHTQHL